MDPGADPTVESRATWNEVAPAWERYRDRMFEGERVVSDELLRAIAPQPGQSILELTAGTGETGFAAAQAVGPSGSVLVTDFAPRMVEAARAGSTARGLANVTCRVIDAQDIDLPSASVDAVISRYGLMLVPDQAAAFSEIRRVLRPGGRLAYAVWGPPDRNLWIMLLGLALVRRGHFQPTDPFAPGGLFSLSSVERNVETLRASGFGEADARAVENPLPFDSFDDYWDLQSQVAGPLAVAVTALPPDEVANIRADVEQAGEPFREGSGYVFPTQTIIGIAS